MRSEEARRRTKETVGGFVLPLIIAAFIFFGVGWIKVVQDGLVFWAYIWWILFGIWTLTAFALLLYSASEFTVLNDKGEKR